MINDVNAIALSGDWSYEEQLQLESQIVLATQSPLCLDPSSAVGLVKERFHHTKNVLSTSSLRSKARRYSQLVANRKRKLEELISSNSPSSNLAKFISRRNSNKRLQTNPASTVTVQNAQQPQQNPIRNPPNIINNKSHISIVNNNNNNNINLNNNNNATSPSTNVIKQRQVIFEIGFCFIIVTGFILTLNFCESRQDFLC